MRTVHIISLTYCGIAIFAMAVIAFSETLTLPKEFPKYYANNLRGQLFPAFIALAGFVFALKTFIIITMKKELYDHQAYHKRYQANLKLDPSLRRYAPLDSLRLLLSWTIVASLLAGVVQLTIGLYPHWLTAFISLSFALYAIILFATAVYAMWANLADLLTYWEQHPP